jgi:pathogenesis-related protein 1
VTASISKQRLVALACVVAACAPAQEAQVVSPAAGPRASGPLRQTVLRAHNTRRARHCAPPLQWSAELAGVATRWARELARRGCPLAHSDTRYGENLAAGSQGGFTAEDYVEMWYREADDYRFKRGRFSMSTGHFTQLAWRSTRRVGCALTACRNGLELLVCNYDPPGNVEGEFTANVLATSCK